MKVSKRNDPIIEVNHLSKQYSIGIDKNYKTLSESFTSAIRRPVKTIKNFYSQKDSFWALKDVNFEVEQGEVLGIIGRNGAGKSTLLKILSRITYPTEGDVKLRGRVGSLLEVGTGFHPELSGRENIYFNGAILGMRKKEIDEKFEEIVKFSGVEKFLDTPVKRYSSGMQVRLAFSVAAHLDPEILIVDEVLTVGDAAFQKKSMGKMFEVAESGRTVLFVSHNMQAIRYLCNRVILLQSGKIAVDGRSSKAIENYLQDENILEFTGNIEGIIQNLPPDPVFKFEGIAITQNGYSVGQLIENGKQLEIEIRYQVFEKTTGLRVFFDLCDELNTIIFRSFHDEDNDDIPIMEPGQYISKAVIPEDLLAPTRYEIRIFAAIYSDRTFYPDGINIPLVVERTGRANRAYLAQPIRGKISPVLHWETKKLTNF